MEETQNSIEKGIFPLGPQYQDQQQQKRHYGYEKHSEKRAIEQLLIYVAVMHFYNTGSNAILAISYYS